MESIRLTTTVSSKLKFARLGVFSLFFMFGLAMSTWAVHIPAVQEHTGISTSLLGTMLLVLGAGALIGMQITGPLITKYGGGRTGIVAGLGMGILLVGPLVAPNVLWLGASLALFGFAMGATDVSMNAHAVVVEQDYERPIMASFHGVFSIGNVVGSMFGALTLALEWSLFATAVSVAAVCVAITLSMASYLSATSRPSAKSADTVGRTGNSVSRRKILLLGVLAFLLFLSEGAAMDWSSIHAQQHLAVTASVGALAFGAFSASMMVGRFTVDRVAKRIGARLVVRYGCGVSFVGMATVMLSSSVPLTLIGWAIFGIGLAGGIPQVLSAAGNLDGATGTDFSRVVGIGYAALLAGPALIGWLAEYIPMNSAMVIPLVAVAICCAAAGRIAK